MILIKIFINNYYYKNQIKLFHIKKENLKQIIYKKKNLITQKEKLNKPRKILKNKLML